MIVYRHRKKDTLEVFYIGITNCKSRPFLKKRRSDFWKKIENKHGRIVEILFDNISKEYACELESFLIKLYGRRDLGTGSLVNMTTGGDHFNHSKESKIKMSKIAFNTFKSHTKGKNIKGRSVIDTSNGNIYKSIKMVAILNNISYSNLRKCLNGELKNKTSFQYY